MRKNTRRSKTLGDLGSEIGIVSITSHFSRRSVSQSDLSDFCNTVKSENITKSNSRKSFDGQGIYEGSLINSKRNGFGKLITFDKKRIIYEGEWKNDKPDGFGTKRFPNGDQHHGHYLTGKRHGWGVYSYINGDKYTGDWSEGLMHGRGRFIWSTGEFYEGKLENGTLTGEGSKTQIDGSEITGSFCNGKAHGYCVKKYACGDEYHGKYEFDQRHGSGSYSWIEGYTYKGTWRLDRMSGAGHKYLRSLDGSARVRMHSTRARSLGSSSELIEDDPVACYMGDYLSGHRWGHGVALFWDESIYQGHWRKDLRHDRGMCWYRDGLLYQGDFVDGTRHGLGSLSQHNRSTVVSNIFEGECALLDVIVQMNAALNPDGDTDPQDTGEVLAPSQGEIMTPEDDMRILRLFSYDVELFLLQADFTDGIRYVGEWMHGHIHGRGTLYRQDSKIISGFFREGIFIPDENI